MSVIFHVIVPLKFWNIEKSDMIITIRFGEKLLGHWKENIGRFICERSV